MSAYVVCVCACVCVCVWGVGGGGGGVVVWGRACFMCVKVYGMLCS